MKSPEEYRIAPGPITKDMALGLVKRFEQKEVKRLKNLEDYYMGEHAIRFRQFEDPSKPNNKPVANYPKYLTDTITGYFLGMPVKYSSVDDVFSEKLQEVFDANSEQAHTYLLGKEASIRGMAFELLYVNEDLEVKMARVPANQAFLVYDTSIEKRPVAGVRFYYTEDYLTNEKRQHIEVYTEDHAYFYVDGNLVEEQVHYFGGVPLIPYFNSDERIGDFENVITLIDLYNQALADTANEMEYFADAYLVLKGLQVEAEDIQNMKENRVMTMDSEGGAEWLTRDMDYESVDGFKRLLRDDIHKFANVPNMNDKDFGTQVSGVALRYKLFGLEQVLANKERLFTRAIKERVRLITNFLNKKGFAFDANDFSMTFTRNLIVNKAEDVEYALKMAQLTSRKTALENVPGIDDVNYELELIKQEQGTGDPILTEEAPAEG